MKRKELTDMLLQYLEDIEVVFEYGDSSYGAIRTEWVIECVPKNLKKKDGCYYDEDIDFILKDLSTATDENVLLIEL
jgi:hypothetical protein